MLVADGSGGVVGAIVAVIVIVVLLRAAFCIAARVSILHSPNLTPNDRALWVVLVLVFQFFGQLAWFTRRPGSMHSAGCRARNGQVVIGRTWPDGRRNP